jgi:hypothetical protein
MDCRSGDQMKRFPLIFFFCISLAGAFPASQALSSVDLFGSQDTTRIETHLGAGALVYYPMYFEQPYVGYQLYWTMRPSAAKYIFEALEQHNIGIEVNFAVLKMTETRGFVDASVIFHKYLTPVDQGQIQDAAFVGVGIGILGVKWDSEDVEHRDVSFTVEMGYEYRLWSRAIVTFKAQARYLEAGPINFNGGGVLVSFGWRRD